MVPRSERILAALAALVLLALLGIGAALRPDPAGHGTHTQLGMPPCGFLSATGHPCPTCGMTTAVSLAARASPLASFKTQPFALLLALGAAVAFWGCLHVAVFGSRLGRLGGRLLRARVLWGFALLWGLSWVYTLLIWPP